MISKKMIALLLLWICASAYSQTILSFDPVFQNQKMSDSKVYYKLPSGDSLNISALKFYISNIRLLKKDRPVFTESNSYHLIDAFDAKTLQIKLDNPKLDYDRIAFTIGIDSLTNVSGAMEGDLDATKGMYWSWQSGYINFKIEGKSNLYNTRKNEFFFHLGGYLPPNQTAQEFYLNAFPKEKILIKADIAKFIGAIHFGKQESTMIPGEKAAWLSKQLPLIFTLE